MYSFEQGIIYEVFGDMRCDFWDSFFLSTVIWDSTSLDEFGSFVSLAATVLLVFGLVGFYLRQITAFGVFGFIVFIITMIGTVLWAGFM